VDTYQQASPSEHKEAITQQQSITSQYTQVFTNITVIPQSLQQIPGDIKLLGQCNNDKSLICPKY
jgi:hypothetical protein